MSKLEIENTTKTVCHVGITHNFLEFRLKELCWETTADLQVREAREIKLN